MGLPLDAISRDKELDESQEKIRDNEHAEQLQFHDKQIESESQENGKEGGVQDHGDKEPAQHESHDKEVESHDGAQDVLPTSHTHAGDKDIESHDIENLSDQASHDMEDKSHDQQLESQMDLSVLTKEASHDGQRQLEEVSHRIESTDETPQDAKLPNGEKSYDESKSAENACLSDRLFLLTHDPVMKESHESPPEDPVESHDSPPEDPVESHDSLPEDPVELHDSPQRIQLSHMTRLQSIRL